MLKCGHPSELAIYSAETGKLLFCDLCDCRSRRNDAEKMEAELRAENRQLREERGTLERRYKQTQSTLDVVLGERDAAREALRTARALAHRAKVRLLELEGYADDGLADEIEDFIENGPSPDDLTDARAALAGPPGYDDCFCTPNNPVHGCGIHDAPGDGKEAERRG